MRTLPVFVFIALAAAGCAVPDRSPEGHCSYFARNEGFQWIRNIKSAPVAGGTAVTMEVKDEFARSFNATCLYSDGKMRWAEPLPSNAARDLPGRSSR